MNNRIATYRASNLTAGVYVTGDEVRLQIYNRRGNVCHERFCSSVDAAAVEFARFVALPA